MPYEASNEYIYTGWGVDRLKVVTEKMPLFTDIKYNHKIYDRELADDRLILEIRNVHSKISIDKVYQDNNVTCYSTSSFLLYKYGESESFKYISEFKAEYYQKKYAFLSPCLENQQ